MSDRTENAIGWILTIGALVLLLVAGPYLGLVVIGYLVSICLLLLIGREIDVRRARREAERFARRVAPPHP